MQLLELPLDVFKLIITFVVRELGVQQSMRARLTCSTFAGEIFDAVIATRAIEEEVTRWAGMWKRINHHHDVIARYLYHRVRADGSATHPWITTIRETSQTFAHHCGSENDPARIELLERNMCLCLAVNAGHWVFSVLRGQGKDEKTPLASSTWANCLAIAAWMGDMTLVESLHNGSDPLSFFGRPSWAAAAQGHADILQFFLDQGALPYEPTYKDGPHFDLSKGPLPVAAYFGREKIVRLYLQHQYYLPETAREMHGAIVHAVYGNQPTTLKILLEYYKRISTPQEFLSIIDHGLVTSCRQGVTVPARIFLDYGADPDESDNRPTSCLQLAVSAGNAPIVKMLLDAGACIEARDIVHRRTSSSVWRGIRQKDALFRARRKGRTDIIKLLEDKQRELLESAPNAAPPPSFPAES